MSKLAFKRLVLGNRVVLGLIFFIFGLNFFFKFIPMPPPEGQAASFLGALINSGYLFTFLKITEISCGLALILNRFVALALIILTPINLNIFLFHFFLEKDEIYFSLVLILIHLFLGYVYRRNYKALFDIDSKFIN